MSYLPLTTRWQPVPRVCLTLTNFSCLPEAGPPVRLISSQPACPASFTLIFIRSLNTAKASAVASSMPPTKAHLSAQQWFDVSLRRNSWETWRVSGFIDCGNLWSKIVESLSSIFFVFHYTFILWNGDACGALVAQRFSGVSQLSQHTGLW